MKVEVAVLGSTSLGMRGKILSTAEYGLRGRKATLNLNASSFHSSLGLPQAIDGE